MNAKMTYSELFAGLKDLGYRERTAEIAGGPAVVLEQSEFGDVARIILPPVDPAAEITSMHALAVRSILETAGLIERDPARELVQRISTNRSAHARNGTN